MGAPYYDKVDVDKMFDIYRKEMFESLDSVNTEINGKVNTTENLSLKEPGVYRAETSGTIGSVVVKEGYYTLLRKLDDGSWVLESEVKMPMQDLTSLENRTRSLENKNGGEVAIGNDKNVTGGEVLKVIKMNKSNLFTSPELIPLIYQSATSSILDIKIYSNNLIGYYAQVLSLNANGTISVSLKNKSDNTGVANSLIHVSVYSLVEITTNIYKGYGYNQTLDYWVEYIIDISKVVAFTTSITDTKVNVSERKYFSKKEINKFELFDGLPILKESRIIHVIKEIEVISSLNQKLRIQSVTNSQIIFYDVNDSNKNYTISKANARLQSNGLYYYNRYVTPDVKIIALIDFDSVNSTNQFATASNTLLYLKPKLYTQFPFTENIYVNTFDASLNSSFQAIKYINIFTNDFDYRYTVQAIRTSGDVLMLYKRDENRVNILTLAINASERVFLNDTLWYFDGYKQGIRIRVIVDNTLITTQFGDVSDRGSDIDFKHYKPIDVYFTKTREYCNLGASTSGGPWHLDAVKRCNMNWRTFNVGSATWAVRTGAVLNTGEYTSSSLDNNAFNQIAKLNLAKTNENYYPDVIGCMFGLTDAQTGGWVVGTFEDAMNADVTSYTAENWQDTAPENYRKNTAICIKAAIYFLSKNFPYSQNIFYTVQQTNSPSYSTENVLKINELIRRLSKEFSIQCIDLGAETGIDGRLETGNIFISGDLIHPNTEGANVMRRYLTKKLQEVVFYKR